jgi:outer membrane protein assembly factor BamB
MRRLFSRRWLRWGLAAVAAFLLLCGGAVAFLLLHTPGNVSHPNLSFTPPTTTTVPTPPPPPMKRTKVVDIFQWPRYGYDAARNRYFAARGLNPPLHVGWRFNDGALLEFPPVIYQKTMYLVDDSGSAKAINKLNGHVIWERKLGTLAAASPGFDIRDKLVFVPILADHGTTPGGGQFAALSMKTGRVVWAHDVPAGTESSPLVWGRTVIFGDQAGNVLALGARHGHTIWSYHASGAVKGGPALADGIVYFGDYAGRAYALSLRTGRQIWAVSTNGARFGFGSGNFYSSPAVAFGRVYMGNTDGRVYSFAAKTGQLAWATGTNAYVYSSPAVDDTPGLGPTVYLGSYDGTFYAFNARSGAVRWTHPAGSRISGSPTIVNNVVYFSALGSKSTVGLDARTGHQVFGFPDGAFNPVIADFKAIYMVGYSTIYQMLPRRSARHRRVAAVSAHKAHNAASKHRKATRRQRKNHHKQT